MVSLSLIRLVLVALLVLQQHTSAQALFGKLRKKEWLKFPSVRKDHDSVDGIIGSAGGIRKMLVHQFSVVVTNAALDSKKGSHMNARVDRQILEKNTMKEESKELVDVEDEVAKLMSKDYSGRSGPRRKPPINNHKPTD
ncbi:hypothetical protein K7X08_019368 [Anisodus acutangulus]|uniref:Uncharacterized protein n=1 Tax=Anisodus acutangulus TaxID=402998 RepID=A0A9Q1MRG7_9SOLA|nr:hypothetical protein K7X08_019368 [Anisodus acutangulus]